MADADAIPGFLFRVRLAELGPRGGERNARELDVQRVTLPAFRGPPTIGTSELPRPSDDAGDRLVLHRGHTGDAYLYDWFEQQRHPKYRGSRRVAVELLDERHKPVTVWHFAGCRLAELRYSPLDALQSTIVMEIADIDFDEVVQRSTRR